MKRIQPIGINTQTSTCQLQSDTKSCLGRDTIFSCLWQRWNRPLHQLLEPMQPFLDNPESGWLNLEAHWLTLAITKKTLDENNFSNAQKTMDRKPPSFQLGYRIVYIECNGYYLHIKNQATGRTRSYNIKDIVHKPPIEFWNINTQIGRAGKYINHPANLPTIMLNNWTWTTDSCK